MKKSIVLLLTFALCVGLCACGGGEEIELPTKPEQIALPSQPVTEPQSGTNAATDNTEAAEPTGETYPWDAEFREEDYVKFNITAPNGDKIVTWREGSILGLERRNLYEWEDDGTISDSYYYPSGNKSHEYTWYTDGAYHETHHLDDGHTDPETGTVWLGTTVYEKSIQADGSESEYIWDENGNTFRWISKGADGSYSESDHYENGNTRTSVFDNPNTGEHSEEEYYENGNRKYYAYKDAAGYYSEQEYFENGNVKYSKTQSPEYTSEERYDEEGYRTYFYSKNADWEQECISDDTGKLVKVIENGTEILDPAILSQYAKNYNFRE